jgi:hypothetical protein
MEGLRRHLGLPHCFVPTIQLDKGHGGSDGSRIKSGARSSTSSATISAMDEEQLKDV